MLLYLTLFFCLSKLQLQLTELRVEALVAEDLWVVECKPALDDPMDEGAHGKPADGQPPPVTEFGGGADSPATDDPGAQQYHPRHREEGEQDLLHGEVISDVAREREAARPVGMACRNTTRLTCHLSREAEEM